MSSTMSAEQAHPPGRRRGVRSMLSVGALALATAAAGTTLAIAPESPAEAVVLPNNFKSVGYMPSWAGDVNTVQYGKLTHINYAFVLPNANGTLRAVENPSKLSALVSGPTAATSRCRSRSVAGTTATTRHSRRWPATRRAGPRS